MFGGSYQTHICDVCRLVDFDTTPKLCFHCGLCDAWICQADASKWGRRIEAALRRKLEPGFVGDPQYTDKIDSEGRPKQ